MMGKGIFDGGGRGDMEEVVCIPLWRMEELVRAEQKYETMVRGIQWLERRGYAGLNDVRTLLAWMGEEVPEMEKDKEENAS